jgi:RimJ/RimL family protein N-acetyltransferase
VTSSELDRLEVARFGSIRLRGKHLTDAQDDYRWRRDPELVRFDAQPVLEKTFEAFVQQFEMELRIDDPNRRMYAIDEIGGGHVGNLMYYNVDGARSEAEFGISIGEDAARSRGLGTEATIAFLRLAWGATPFRRIFLHTLEWNDRAIRCFEKAGFQPVARVQRGEDFFLRMETRREWWLLWDTEGRFLPRAR